MEALHGSDVACGAAVTLAVSMACAGAAAAVEACPALASRTPASASGAAAPAAMRVMVMCFLKGNALLQSVGSRSSVLPPARATGPRGGEGRGARAPRQRRVLAGPGDAG